MANYFADSSFWIALVDQRDSFHAKAVDWSEKISGQIVSTRAVLLETANAFSKPAWRMKAIPLIDHVQTRPDIEVVPLSDPLWNQAWKLFCERLDKAWSLTDCISMEVMRERGISDALTSDSHFRQAGFNALLLD